MAAVRTLEAQFSINSGDATSELQKLNKTMDDLAQHMMKGEKAVKKQGQSASEASEPNKILDGILSGMGISVGMTLADAFKVATEKLIEFGVEASKMAMEEENNTQILKNLSGTEFPQLSKAIADATEKSQGMTTAGDMTKASISMMQYAGSAEEVANVISGLQKMSVAYGGDMQTMASKYQNFVLTGQAKSLKAMGPIFAKEMEQAKAMVNATEEQRSAFLQMIMKKHEAELDKDYAEQLKTTASAMTQFKNAASEAQQNLGYLINEALDPLLRILTPIVGYFADGEKGTTRWKNALINLTNPFIAFYNILRLVTNDIYHFFAGDQYSLVEHFLGPWQKIEDWFRALPDKLISYLLGLGEKLGAQLKGAIPPELMKIFEGASSIGASAFNAGKDFVMGPGHASGGPVSAGVTYPVGEQGPELFTPSTSGTIIPNGGTSGGTFHITFGTIPIAISSQGDLKAALLERVSDAIDELAKTVWPAALGIQVA